MKELAGTVVVVESFTDGLDAGSMGVGTCGDSDVGFDKSVGVIGIVPPGMSIFDVIEAGLFEFLVPDFL